MEAGTIGTTGNYLEIEGEDGEKKRIPEPSREDRIVTERIKAATDLCGIAFLDHVIVGGAWSGKFYSLREAGVI